MFHDIERYVSDHCGMCIADLSKEPYILSKEPCHLSMSYNPSHYVSLPFKSIAERSQHMFSTGLWHEEFCTGKITICPKSNHKQQKNIIKSPTMYTIICQKRDICLITRALNSTKRALHSTKRALHSTKEPYILPKEPYILSKQPCV